MQVSEQYERKLCLPVQYLSFLCPFQIIKGIGQSSAIMDINQANIPFNSLVVQVTLPDLKQPTGHLGMP